MRKDFFVDKELFWSRNIERPRSVCIKGMLERKTPSNRTRITCEHVNN